MQPVSLTVIGEPVSGKNSRQIVTNFKTGRPMLIKSQKARAYEKAIKAQVRALDPMLTGKLKMKATLYYATERPDLDGELLIDALQGLIYANDRQVREKHLIHAIDRSNPRAEILIEPLQGELFQEAA